MAADEPPYLTVGTDVSAKYKGAFCEAKIKKVNRMVKCKVTFKNNQGSLMLTDDQIRGPLRTGAEVEARHPDKNQYLDAVINKMQDYSQYTVVFDDGDETTLRRTSLCLKSGRHFAESPTLDQFPLTNPEHFGTPVIGAVKTKRKRRSTMNSAALDYYSSDEELLPKKTKPGRSRDKDPDVGKVVCVDYGDKRKKDSWYPGLIVTPDSSTQDSMKLNTKEEYFIRSFKDGKYYQVYKKDTREFNRESCRKVDGNLRAAVDKALLYQEKGELPPHWDKALYQSFEIASPDEESQDTDTDSSDDEPSEEKDRFVAQLYKFMDERGTPINKAPTVGSRDLNLYKLFKVVHKMGGYNRVTNQNKWKIVYMKMGLPSSNISGSNQIKVAYKRYLHSFEDFYRKLGCTMVTNTRSTRGRHRSDRNIIITRNRDRDTASPKSNKSSSKEPKDKSIEKKPEEKSVEIEKKDISSKVKSEKVESSMKSEDKMKKKVVEKPKSEEKDQKVKLKPKEEQKPRLVRSQSLNSKDKKDGNEDVKDQRTVRSRTREDLKKDKMESPEKKETRSSTKVEQENDRKDRDSPGKRSPSSSKDSKDRFTKDKKTEKVSSTEDKAIRKSETLPKEKKWEKVMREKVIKDDKLKSVMCEDKCVKEKKEVLKKSEEGNDKKPKLPDTDSDKNNNSKSLREKKEKPKSDLHVKRVKEENVVKTESDVKCSDTKLLKEETEVKCLQETKIIKKEPAKEKKIDVQSLDGELPDVKSAAVTVEQIQQDFVKTEDGDDVDSLTSQGERKNLPTEEADDNSKTNFMDSDEEDGSADKSDFKEKVEVGDRVRVKYGRGRTQKVYEAKVLKAEVNNGEKRYYVHYAGWNMRYDEWVKRSFIVENISDRFRSGKQPKLPIVNKGTTVITTMISTTNSISPATTITSTTSVISSGFTATSPSVSGVTSPATQKKEKIKSGVITSAKLSRKNSTSSTNSVSSSRTTRSDKNSLQSSPFSRGLLPKKRKRKKSGLSSSLTDMSQESESDEDQLSLLDPDEDDDDADLETDCTQSSRGPKDESFSEDDKDSLDYFERNKTSEEKSTSEEPLSCTKEELRSEELSDDTLNGVEENSATEIPASIKSSNEQKLEQGTPLVKTAFEKDNESEIKIPEEPVPELSDINPLLKVVKDDMPMPKNLNKPIFDHTIPELKDSYENTSKKDFPSTSSALPDVQTASSVEKTDISVGMLAKPPIISMNTSHAISKSSESVAPIVSESNVITSPGTDQQNSEVNTNRIKSVSELIETRYVEKKTEKIETLNEPKEIVEEKMPSLMSYMESHDNHNVNISDVKDDKIQPRPSGNIEMPSSSTQEGKPKDPGCFSIFSSYMTSPSRIGNTASINESFKSKSFSDDSNSASNLLMNFGMTAQRSASPSKPTKMFSFLDEEPPSTKPHFSSDRLPFSSRMSSKLDVSVTKSTEPKSFKKYLKGDITKASLTPSPKLPEKDPFSIDLISDNENSSDEITDYSSKSRSIIGSKALSETAGAKALCNLSCQKSLTYSECRSKKVQAEPYGFRVDVPETSTSSSSQQPKKNIIDFTFHKKTEIEDSSPKTNLEANLTEKKSLVVPRSENSHHETSVSRGVKDTCLPASVITFACGSSSIEKHGCENPVEKGITAEIKTTSTASQPLHIDLNAKLPSIPQSFVPESNVGVHNINAILENKSDDARDISINIKNIDVKEEEADSEDDDIHEIPKGLSIEKKENKDTKIVESIPIMSKEDICNAIISKDDPPYVKLDPDNVKKEVKNFFSNVEVAATSDIAQSNSQKSRDISVIKKENEISEAPIHGMPYIVRKSPPAVGNDNSTESDSCFGVPVVKKEVKKKKTKLSKLEKRLGCGESSRDESGKLKEGKGKSKKKKLDNDEFGKLKDSDQKSKSKKVKKNKSKKHFSKYDDHNIEIFNKSDTIDDNTKEVSEKMKRKEKRKRDEKKLAKLDKSESSSEHKGEYSKKEKKKGRKNRISGDKKTEMGEKKMKKKKKSHVEDMDSDSEKESSVRVGEKKKKKEKKKLKIKDCSSSDDAIDPSKAMREDQDISFLLCEEKVPASPVNNVPEDTSGSSSMEDSSRSNRSPISPEERAPTVNLGMYSRSASIDVLNAMNKHNPEHNPCPVLDNTPPTTPSSTESIPSSPSHDREPFMHYTESTQSGRDSAEGEGAESDGFNCESNRSLCESEEYRAAKTLAFAVCKSVSGKMAESSRTPVKRQKSENDEYTPSKKKKRSKRSCSYGGDSGRSGSHRGFSPRYSKGENYDAFDSSGASPIAVRSPTHGGASSSLYASFSHAASQHMSLMSDSSGGMPSRSSKLNFFVPLHEYKDPEKRISILQDKMSELRKLYASLKAEVASIDRRKKKARKKGKESATSNANNSSTYSEDLQDCS